MQPRINTSQIQFLLSSKVKIEIFLESSSYMAGVLIQKDEYIYLSLEDITPGAFDETKWLKLGDASDIQNLQNEINNITSKIPAEASSTNQLADKDWVNQNAGKIDSISVNGTKIEPVDKNVDIKVPTQASDINALPDTTKYGSSLDLSIDNTTFILTAKLKDQDGNVLGEEQTIDLPLESVVVDGKYDPETKEVVLTLQNGTEIRFSVADLVSGLQTEITEDNKLSADLVDDTDTTNKFVTVEEKTIWDGKQDKLIAGEGIKIEDNTISTNNIVFRTWTEE